MSGYGKDVAPIASQLLRERRNYIDLRAERLNWSRAEVVTRAIDFWFAMGAPALSELDSQVAPIPIPVGARVEGVSYWEPYINRSLEIQAAVAAHLLARRSSERGQSGVRANSNRSVRK